MEYMTEEEFINDLIEKYALEECEKIGYKVTQRDGKNLFPMETLDRAHFRLIEEGILELTDTN